MWATIIVIAVIVVILGCAIGYIIRAKKKGVKCIGCPAGSSCGGHCCAGSKKATTEDNQQESDSCNCQ